MARRGWFAGCVTLVLLVGATAADVAARQPSTLRVYLARHGQTDGNLNAIAQGWTDSPLNATGRQQAAQLAERLQGVPLDAIYASTLSRSRETAQVVAASRTGVTVSSMPELREGNLGRFENLSITDPVFKSRPLGEERGPDDGEKPSELAARVKSAIDAIRAKHQSGNILMVIHSGTVGNILGHLLGLTVQEVGPVGMGNDELYLIEITQGVKPRLFKFIPQTSFLEL